MIMKLDGYLSYERRVNPLGKHVVYIRDKKIAAKLQGYVDRAITGRAKILATYIEQKPRINYLPELAKAVHFANSRNATLIIPNIHYLSRSLAAINSFRELEGSNPYLLTVNDYDGKPFFRKEYVETFVGVFERANEYRSEKIKASINQKKKDDPNWKPGNTTNGIFARHQAELARQAKADLFVKEIIPVIRKIQAADRTTLQEIADSLMDQRKLTPRGKKTWTPTTVRLLLIRAEKLRR